MSLLSRTWRDFGANHCTLLAAAISYHVLFSFIPLITFLIAILGFVMRDPAAQQSAADRVLQLLPLQSASGSDNNLILDTIRSVARQSGTLTVIGLLGLIWSSSGIFGTIRSALNIAWNVKAKRGFIMDALLDIGAVLGLGLLFAASLAGTIFMHSLQTMSQTGSFSGASQNVFMILGLVLPAMVSFTAFLLLYRYVPNVRHGVGDVWPGAALAAVLFEIVKHGFAFYVAHFNRYQALYGALGAVMLFMFWTYLSSIILLIGAEFASAFEAGRHGRPHEAQPTDFEREERLPRAAS
jgi:membrane protein